MVQIIKYIFLEIVTYFYSITFAVNDVDKINVLLAFVLVGQGFLLLIKSELCYRFPFGIPRPGSSDCHSNGGQTFTRTTP